MTCLFSMLSSWSSWREESGRLKELEDVGRMEEILCGGPFVIHLKQ